MLPFSDTYTPSKNWKKIELEPGKSKSGKVTDAHFSDILVPDSADLLDIGSTLGHGLDGVAGELELVLDVGGLDDLDASLRDDAAHSLLAKEVTICQNPVVSILNLELFPRSVWRGLRFPLR